MRNIASPWAQWFISAPNLPRVCMTPPPRSAPGVLDEEHDRKQIERILAMSDAEIEADCKARGVDIHAMAEEMRGFVARIPSHDPPGAA